MNIEKTGYSLRMHSAFIAILELVKRRRLEFLQTSANGPIWLQLPSQINEDDSDDDPNEQETEI